MVSRTSTMTAAISTSPAMTLTTTQQESGAGTASAVSPSRQTATTAPKDCLLSCRCESPKSLALLFQSLSQSTKGNNNQPMTINATAQGLTIHANPNKQWQASLELPASSVCFPVISWKKKVILHSLEDIHGVFVRFNDQCAWHSRHPTSTGRIGHHR
jgi:hypothetical protein